MDEGNDRSNPGNLEQTYRDYTVYDQHYEKVGRVDDLFVDERDRPEYIGVKTGFLGMKSTLIPAEIVRINDRRQLVEVAVDAETIRQAPTFDDDNDITPDYEDRVHAYFGLGRPESMLSSGSYGGYYGSPTEDLSREEELHRSVDTEFGERAHEPARPAATTPSAADREDLDAPLAETGAPPETPREEAGSPFDADAATRTEGETREDVEVTGDREVRVFKRARR